MPKLNARKKPRPVGKRKHGLSQLQRLLQQSIRHSIQIAALQRQLAECQNGYETASKEVDWWKIQVTKQL